MLNKLTSVEPLGGFRLRLRFKDGAVGEHDFAPLVARPGSMLEPLRDPAYFARVSLDHGAPTWPNGYDMCPDAVRMMLEEARELQTQAAAE